MDNDECKIPCVGLFADVKKLAPKYDRNIKHLVFLERYKAYKRYFETASGEYFHFKSLQVPGAPVGAKN